uniref:Uncharacterized protein n=1 Tax=Anguilla anguilla TaxID=7936 RepID=A0A0E9S2H7_ANGAN
MEHMLFPVYLAVLFICISTNYSNTDQSCL